MKKVHKNKEYSIVGKSDPTKPLSKLPIRYSSFIITKQFVRKIKSKYPESYFEIWKVETKTTIYKI